MLKNLGRRHNLKNSTGGPGDGSPPGKISGIYVNRGPGSFAGIRNSLSVVKAFSIVNKTDYYCFSFEDFDAENDANYENIPKLCKKYRIKKNLINPIY